MKKENGSLSDRPKKELSLQIYDKEKELAKLGGAFFVGDYPKDNP